MRRLSILLSAIFLSIFLAVTVIAGPTGTPELPQGLQNAKKVMKARIERDKKMHEKINKGQAKKAEAQLNKELKSQNGKE